MKMEALKLKTSAESVWTETSPQMPEKEIQKHVKQLRPKGDKSRFLDIYK